MAKKRKKRKENSWPRIPKISACALCGGEDILEYIIGEHWSFRYCPECKISSDPGRNARETILNWNKLQRTLKEEYAKSLKNEHFVNNARNALK